MSLGGDGLGWGLHSHFCVQPTYRVDVVFLVVLCCRLGCDNRKIYETNLGNKIPDRQGCAEVGEAELTE